MKADNPTFICWGDYVCSKISELRIIPHRVAGDLLFLGEQCKKIYHLGNCNTRIVNGYVDARALNLRTLEGIGRHRFLTINGGLLLPRSIRSNILGLMKVEGLPEVKVYPFNYFNDNEIGTNLRKAIEIVNSHLASEERCIMSCKEDLMAAGLKDLAKL
jgi:hypothetical protein